MVKFGTPNREIFIEECSLYCLSKWKCSLGKLIDQVEAVLILNREAIFT